MRLSATTGMSGFAVFRQKIGRDEQEAVVPLETRDPQGFVIWFDNTSGYSTGVAIANTTPQPAAIAVQLRDDAGRSLGAPPLSLPAYGHISFDLAQTYRVTAGIRGTVEFRKPEFGEISVLGLRFNPQGSFTTIPPVSR
jgi:hypothetical protein